MTQTVTLGGNPIQVGGTLPTVGSTAPAFSLVAKDLNDTSLEKFAGKRKVLNIFPSIDTPTCATSVRKFNTQAAQLNDTVVLCISADLPFAQSVKSGICCKISLNRLMTYGLRTARHREDIAERVG